VPFTPTPVLRGRRVLLVEDEPHTRAVVQWLLEQCDADVAAFGSAAAALDALRRRRRTGPSTSSSATSPCPPTTATS
jgi:CheY-like chemotaxis protein